MVPAHRMPFVEGAMTKLASADGAAVERLLVKAAHACMFFSDMGHLAPAMHLKLVSDQSHWGPHCEEVATNVSRALSVLEPMHKQAFAEITEGIGAGTKGLGYASLGAGAGLGSLYWLLSRHANQEAANLEASKKQIEYYHQLSRELNHSMRRKYHYDPASQAPGEQEETAHALQ